MFQDEDSEEEDEDETDDELSFDDESHISGAHDVSLSYSLYTTVLQ